MKALQITSYDGPAGLRYQDAPEPQPGPGQVTIRTEYAGVNYVEALFAEGMAEIELPWTPGLEASGRVHAVGEGADFAVGDRVAAFINVLGAGGYSQISLANAATTAPVPPGMDMALASVVPSNTTTALAALERTVRLRPGEHVLVQAAAGGLGTQFGQVAKLMGAGRVVGVVGSEAKRETALSLGYDEAWLRTELPHQEGNQFDVIIDPVSGPARATLLNLLRFEGRLLALGDAAQAGDQLISSNALWFNGVSVLGFHVGNLFDTHPKIGNLYLRRALELVATGQVTVPIQGQRPIQEGAQALAELRAGNTIGKFVFKH